jgi:hypothetical protein
LPGRLIASHIYRQVAGGPGGGDVLKRSVKRPEARALVERIGATLNPASAGRMAASTVRAYSLSAKAVRHLSGL